jgi:hypothetical protein
MEPRKSTSRRRACREKGWLTVPQNPSNETQIAGEEGAAVATAVRTTLGQVRAGEPLRAGALTLIPLPDAPDAVHPTGYLPLEAALREQVMQITEQQRESVPELLATSTADLPVIMIGGEQVVGGLQNRVLNTTILVAAKTTLHVPVTCVEAGRWHAESVVAEGEASADAAGYYAGHRAAVPPSRSEEGRPKGMERAFASDEAAYASLRKMHASSVTYSLAAGGGYHSDQRQVWSEVDERITSTGSHSPTSAMQTLYKSPERASRMREMLAAVPRPEGALGFVALVDGKLAGAELFADEALAGAYWDKLARTYAVDALDAVSNGDTTAEQQLIEQALAADVQVYASPGLGRDVRLSAANVSGAGLVYEGTLVHLSLFPEDQAAATSDTATTQAEAQRVPDAPMAQQREPRRA